MELTPWQRLLELAYHLDIDPARGRDALIDVVQLLRDRGQLSDQALDAAIDTVAQDRGLL